VLVRDGVAPCPQPLHFLSAIGKPARMIEIPAAIRRALFEPAIRTLPDPGELAPKGARRPALIVLYPGSRLICHMRMEELVHEVCLRRSRDTLVVARASYATAATRRRGASSSSSSSCIPTK